MHYQLLPKSWFYCPNLITAEVLLRSLEIKRFVTWLRADDITTTWGIVPNGTLLMMLTYCPNLMFLASLWLEMYLNFQIGHFAAFEQFKVDVQFVTSGQVKIDPICSHVLTLDNSESFYWVWVRHGTKNNPNPLSLIKINEPNIGSSTFQIIFNDSISGNQELVSSVKK